MQMQWPLFFFPCAIVPLQPFVSTCKKIKIARVSYRLVNQRTKSLSDLLITKWLRTAVICSSFFPLATVRRCPCPCLLSTCGILSPGDNAAPRRSPSSRAHVAALCSFAGLGSELGARTTVISVRQGAASLSRSRLIAAAHSCSTTSFCRQSNIRQAPAGSRPTPAAPARQGNSSLR